MKPPQNRVLASGLKIAEVIALRSIPGLMNLGTIVALGQWLGIEPFGLYSTAIATALAVASFAIGPLGLGIVSQLAAQERLGQGSDYLRAVTTMTFGVASAVAFGGALFLTVLGSDHLSAALVAPAFIVHSTFQEVLRARLRLWAFGATATCQAVAFAVLAFLLVRDTGDIGLALLAFAASYALGGATAFLLCGAPLPGLRLRLLRPTLAAGSGLTLSTMAEHALLLGIRYVMLAFGQTQALGAFSYGVDVATRAVGFFINAASFAFVPSAFANAEASEPDAFRGILMRGAAVALVLAAFSMLLILAIYWSGLVRGVLSGLFDPVTFVLVSIGVVINRTVKLTVEPFAMRSRLTMKIAAGYALGTIAAVALATAGATLNIANSGSIAFLFGYAASAILASYLVRAQV